MSNAVMKLTLKEFLKSNGLSAYQLAREVRGVKEQAVYAIVRGDRKPSWESLDYITSALSRLLKRRVRLEEFVEHVLEEEGNT